MISDVLRAIRRSFWLRRIATSILTLVLASAVVFVILRLIPGDPTTIRAARPGIDAEQLAALREQMRLDDPIIVQYFAWIGGVLRGDFGSSYFSEYSTTDLILNAVGPTGLLALTSLVLATLAALGLTLLAATFPGGLMKSINRTVMSVGLSLPAFVIAILLIIVFGQGLRVLPTRGYEDFFEDPAASLRYLALPALTMGIALTAPILRMLQSSMQEVMRNEYIRSARAVGLSDTQVVLRHALRNAFVPTLVFIGVSLGHLLGGAVVVEYIFAWPGLGTLAVQAVFTRDYPVLQGVVLFAALTFVVVSFLTDVATRWMDPRTKEFS